MNAPTFPVEERLRKALRDDRLPAPRHEWSLDDAGLTSHQLVELFESQVLSRQLDLHSRRLQAQRQTFYTIGSAGHEGNAAIAAALRHTDPAFLHYRDAAFVIQRSKQLPGQTITWDLLLSFAASADDPISGGRHKVLGSKALNIPPQTSTIASQLPKAVGAAFSVGLNRRLGLPGRWRDDSVIACSFGDASVNHSTAQGAFNTASWVAYQGLPLPLVWICEDNGLGISVPTPQGWIEAAMSHRPALHYVACDGLDLLDTHRAARMAVDLARTQRKPVLLHMRCVRLMGHAGSDAEQGYLTAQQIEANESVDPLLFGAALVREHAGLAASQILELYEDTGRRVAAVAQDAIKRPKLACAEEVMASIVPPARPSTSSGRAGELTVRPSTSSGRAGELTVRPSTSSGRAGELTVRPSTGSGRAGELTVRPSTSSGRAGGLTAGPGESSAHAEPVEAPLAGKHPLGKLLNHALERLMLRHPHMVIAGEDVGRKGGVYGVTQRLQQRFGAARVMDTLLDEQSILGLGIGLAHNGLLPVVEIQFLAYLHNAEDQLRGEAATLSFFSKGQFTNPMVIRIAGLGYQKGFGGHFHNDNAIAVLRDIPGILVACPSNAADAVGLLQEAVRLADEEQRVVVFLEPIALYHTRDLHAPDDGLWSFEDPGAGHRLARGVPGIHGEGRDLAIVSYGNGAFLARQAAAALGAGVRIVDLRWLTGVDHDAVRAATHHCRRVLVVDECRRSGSLSEELVTELVARGRSHADLRRLTAADSFIPLGTAATCTLPSKESIVAAARELLR